jgi:serine phosphatase RsbU (regulator of sigma subunit)
LTWPAFRGAVLLQIAKLVFHPFGGQKGDRIRPGPLPESPLYQCETFFLPHDRVGDYWFGGDWFGGWETHDGCLWVLIADVTGHGYRAYLLASALPSVWETCWNQMPSASPQPAELLHVMHRLLADCLPEGIFVECTLARLDPQGQVTIAPAGGSRLLLRCGQASCPDLFKLRGTWLGLKAPSLKDQRTWVLADGDELLLGSDGVFDHLEDQRGPFEELLNTRGASPPLFVRVRDLLQQILERHPQKDDITMVLLRRRASTGGDVPLGQTTARIGNGDVSV